MEHLPAYHLHLDVVMILGTIGLAYWWLHARVRAHRGTALLASTRKQSTSFYMGLGLVGVVSTWPLHDLAETSLYWVHMVDHMVITLFAPPLMILGLGRKMADRIFGHRWVRPWLKPLARPAAAFSIFNLGMVATHWPEAVALSLRNEFAHFVIHAFLFGSAVLMWLPLVSPSTVITRITPPMQLVYLFLNSILPTIPASILTFSNVPIYPAYGEASLLFGLTPVADQTIAGLIMKIGGTLYFWILMAVIWFRWASEEKQWDQIEEELRTVP